MNIHVVQPGETIDTIANLYSVSVDKLIQDNELINPDNLVVGQTIVIVYPTQTYTVQDGDTLEGIAAAFEKPIMQLLRNNPFLAERKNIYPGETLVISYDTIGTTTTFGYSYAFINKQTLIKTLPNLTYLSVFNYKATIDGRIDSFFDDTEVIRLSKEYNTIPLMMLSTLSPQGEPDVEVTYEILLNEEYQDLQLNNLMDILKAKGYRGVNFVFHFLSTSNQNLYQKFITKVSDRLFSEGYFVFVTIDPGIQNLNGEASFPTIDFTKISAGVNAIIFVALGWGTNSGPPLPVTSIKNLRDFVDYAITLVPRDKFHLGIPIIAYDWILPYIPSITIANSLTLDSAISLAATTGTTIQFDNASQTPYFQYNLKSIGGPPHNHIVCSIDARSMNGLIDIVTEYGLSGTGDWNVMVYIAQLWLIINSRYDIIKL